MNAATFDTYAAAKRLRDAGFDERQAEAAVSMVRDAAGADREQLATKADVAELKGDVEALRAATKADLAGLEARMYRALWIQAAALIGTQLAIAGFVVHLLSQP